MEHPWTPKLAKFYDFIEESHKFLEINPRKCADKHLIHDISCSHTKQGTWARLTILEGELKYHALDKNGDIQSTHICSTENPLPFVEPQAWHKVEPLGENLRCFWEFYCLPEHFYQKKYHLSAPHSEVIEVLKYIQSGDPLDLGSVRGRFSEWMNRVIHTKQSLRH